MAVKMVAIRQFDGYEGFIEKGAEFEVERQDRAEALEKYGVAKPAKAVKITKDEQAAN